MDTPITPATNISVQQNGEYSATVNGVHHSGICEGGSEWPNVQKAIEDGADVEPYVPHIVTPEELMSASDRKLISMSARYIEDCIDRDVASGNYVSQEMKDISAERKVLREPLTVKARLEK